MYVQMVTYGLGAMSESEYLDVANDLAPRYAGIPGLQAKIWLEDPDRGRYGAIYFWDEQESMERFVRSGLFEGTSPNLFEVESEGYGIFENLTAQTQPALEVIEPRRQPAVGRRPQTPKAAPTARAVSTGGARKTPVTTKAAPVEAAPTAATKAAPAKKSPARKSVKKSVG